MTRADEKQIVRIMTLMALLYMILSAATLCFAAESLSYTGELPPDKKPPLEWGKDPFTPQAGSASGAPVATGGMRLTAVFYNETNPSAIIDDMIVYRGSVIRGQKVVDIGVTHVILQGEYGPLRLDLTGEPEPNGRSK